MTPDASIGGEAWLRPGEARQRALRILEEGGQLAPSQDGAVIAYAVLALADAITDASRRLGDAVDQAVNSLDASIAEMGREIGRRME